MDVDFLEGIKAEREEQRKRYLRAFTEALELGNLDAAEQAEFDRLDKAVEDLITKSNAKEAQLQALAAPDHDEYVSEMVELCDQEAKAFSRVTDDLKKLVQAAGLRRGGISLSAIKKD